MNEELKGFIKKKCEYCGGFFYKLKTEWPKYNVFMCEKCSRSILNDKISCMKYSGLYQETKNDNNDKKYNDYK